MRFILLAAICIYTSLGDATVFGQDRPLVQLNGIVRGELLTPIPFVHVRVKSAGRGTITDLHGIFTIITQASDTVLFTSVGFRPKQVRIPANPASAFYTVDVILEQDTILIPEVDIYPWKTYEEFRQAFIALQLPETDMERARKNIALIRTQIMLSDEPMPASNFRYVMQQQYNRLETQHQIPSLSLLNPFAWAQFIKALKEGEYKKKERLNPDY